LVIPTALLTGVAGDPVEANEDRLRQPT